MKKYPKDIGPQSDAEMYAWLFGMLSGAYNVIAQYEAEERDRERRRIEESLIGTPTWRERRREAAQRAKDAMDDCPIHGDRSDPAKTAAAHKEDEQQ